MVIPERVWGPLVTAGLVVYLLFVVGVLGFVGWWLLVFAGIL